MRYVGIEGSSYVGKTTVGENLQGKGSLLIPEYDTFGPFPESDGTAEGLMAIIDDLLIREIRRTQLLSQAALHVCIYSDRTPISLLTFEDMMIGAAESKRVEEIHRRVKDYATDEIYRSVESGDIVMPQKIAVLRMSNRDAFLDRVRMRGITGVQRLADFDVQYEIAQRAVGYAEQLIGKQNVHTFDVDNLTTEEVADKVEGIAINDVHSPAI